MTTYFTWGGYNLKVDIETQEGDVLYKCYNNGNFFISNNTHYVLQKKDDKIITGWMNINRDPSTFVVDIESIAPALMDLNSEGTTWEESRFQYWRVLENEIPYQEYRNILPPLTKEQVDERFKAALKNETTRIIAGAGSTLNSLKDPNKGFSWQKALDFAVDCLKDEEIRNKYDNTNSIYEQSNILHKELKAKPEIFKEWLEIFRYVEDDLIGGGCNGRDANITNNDHEDEVVQEQVVNDSVASLIMNDLAPKTILTTNYDNVLELAETVKGRKTIVHLHGYYENPGSIVLGEDSYNKVIDEQRDEMWKWLKFGAIFVGCKDTLSDPHFQKYLLKEMTISWRCYILMRTGEAVPKIAENDIKPNQKHDVRLKNGMKISFIEYGSKHTDLYGFLYNLR